MRFILASVKEKWASLIFEGRKSIELRRKRPAESIGECNDAVFICYGGKIHGACRVWFYETIPPLPYLENDERFIRACVTEKEWRAYKPRFAWRLDSVRRLKNPVPLSELGIDRAPQSWQYLTHEQRERLALAFMYELTCADCASYGGGKLCRDLGKGYAIWDSFADECSGFGHARAFTGRLCGAAYLIREGGQAHE